MNSVFGNGLLTVIKSCSVWVARRPPGYAFVEFDDCRDAMDAIRALDVYTPEQLAEKYNNITFLFYCVILVTLVGVHHYIYRRGEILVAYSGHDVRPYWKMLLPFSYAVVSGAIGSCSVLFAKSLYFRNYDYVYMLCVFTFSSSFNYTF
ncbi:Serine/arginine-rich splicing factor 3 [Euphorbia peplus]|nr:Serine/arginine-rich splicing factor 3 [Euphorbia peplus]